MIGTQEAVDSVGGDPSGRRRNAVVRETALTIGAIAGLLCVLATAAALFFGITPLVFRSGSMSPAIDTGALALAKDTPATELRVGDIVNVTNTAGTAITHRIVSVEAPGSNAVTLTLKGDDNDDADTETYVVSDAKRVIFSVPKLGYIVTWLSGPVAVFTGGVLVGVLLMIAWRPSGARGNGKEEASDETVVEPPPEPTGRHSRGTLGVLAVLSTIGALGLASANTPTTLARGADSAPASSGSFTVGAGVVLAPTDLTCTTLRPGLGLTPSAQLTWKSSGQNFTYRIVLTKAGSPDVVINVGTKAAMGTVMTYNVQNGNGGLINAAPLSGTYTASVRAVSGQKVSGPTTTLPISFNPGVIGVLPSAQCGTVAPAAQAAPAAPATTTTPPTATTVAPTTVSSAPAPAPAP
ncbi:MAG: signal peptidase I, partial [Rhodococcus sp. (in: high G+C Gram-positive bacteria)]